MANRQVTAELTSVAPYSQSRALQSIIGDHEGKDEFDERVWRERMHVQKGEVFIPPMSIYHALIAAAKFRNQTIKGQGMKTYTKRFEAGILIFDPIMLGIKAKDVPGERLFVPSDGKPGGGKRVWRRFPLIADWSATVSLILADDLIGEDIFRSHIEDAGKFVGLGRFRPERRGFYGRFQVDKLTVN